MDGVILFVSGHTYSQVEDLMRPYGLRGGNVSDGTRTFYFRHYPEWFSETAPGEAEKLSEFLGGPITAAFAVEARHGENSRFALEALAGVMQSIDRALVEDQFGELWTSTQVAASAGTADSNIFLLSEANPSLKRTPDGAA